MAILLRLLVVDALWTIDQNETNNEDEDIEKLKSQMQDLPDADDPDSADEILKENSEAMKKVNDLSQVKSEDMLRAEAVDKLKRWFYEIAKGEMKDDLIDIQELTTYLFRLLDKEENKAVRMLLAKKCGREDFNAEMLMELIDTDKDSKINYDEWCSFINARPPKAKPGEFKVPSKKVEKLRKAENCQT